MKWDDTEYRPLTEKIIKAFYNVHNTLGPGFLEKVYRNALLIELKNLGLKADSEKCFPVPYDDEEVGKYYPDVVVEDKVIVELSFATVGAASSRDYRGWKPLPQTVY